VPRGARRSSKRSGVGSAPGRKHSALVIAQHSRRNPAGEFEHHPAMLALLRHVRTGEPCGVINVYLQADGSDRLRDAKGKTTWGRARGAAVMLDPFDEPTYGLNQSRRRPVTTHTSPLTRPTWRT
jgi:hypothetical protein